MTNGTTTEPASLKLTKGTNWGETIYNVELDGVKVGWVRKSGEFDSQPGWSFYAHIRDSIKAEVIAQGCSTRRNAIMDGISHLEIYRSGWVVVADPDDVLKVEDKIIDPARLRALWQKLLDEKFPTLKENS